MPSKTAKGSIRKYEVSAVAWIDLLGYGSMLEEVNFDPTQIKAIEAVERLNNFQTLISKHSNRYLPMIAMNDGVIAFRDLSPRTNSVTYDFIKRCLEVFKDVNEDDIKSGFFGARMIISSGFRIRVNKDTYSESKKGKNLLKKIENNEISAAQAIHEALVTRPNFGVIPELQGNFAFTKSYLVDSLGKKGGFGGNNCFIDFNFFQDKKSPNWIEFDEIINWQQMGMISDFGRFKSINVENARKNNFKGILDAFEIAENITNDKEVLTRIRNSRIRDNGRKK